MRSSLKSALRALLPRRLKAHRILSGPNRGFRLVTSWHDYPSAILGYCETPLLSWLDANVGEGETWLDIGAHYGNTAVRIADRVGQKGRVLLFEPNLASVGCLSQTRRLNGLPQWMILPFGLAAGNGISLLKLPEIRGMMDSTVKVEDADFFETILVTPFAELWPQVNGGDGSIHGVKIDVQGMEIEVLRGLAPVLAAHKPKLIVEVHAGVSRPELLTVLNEIGYSSKAIPIEPEDGETEAQFHDNRIYHFPLA